MAKAITPLTDTQIKNAKVKEEREDKNGNKIKEKVDYQLSDGNGLSLLITKDGKKWWRFNYISPLDKKRKIISLGVYPDTSLAVARTLRDEARKKVAQGLDPSKERQDAKAAIVEAKEIEQELLKSQFHLVAYEWLGVMATKTDAKVHTKRVRAFERDIYPYFCTYDTDHKIVSSKCISEIKHSELLKCIKTKEINAPETAHRLLADCNRLWAYAASCEYAPFNITVNISKDVLVQKKVKHISKITDEKILAELLNAIDGYTGSPITRNALKFVALIPLRRERLAQLKWEYVDFEKEILTLPRQIMKNKNENLPEFTIPLSKQAVQVLKDVHIITGWGVWVFHGITNFKAHMSLETCNKALRLLGFNNEATGRKQSLHSFRGTFRSLADTHHAQHNASFETKEAVLDHHTQDKTVAAYNHQADYVEQMRKLLQWWGDYLDRLKVEG